VILFEKLIKVLSHIQDKNSDFQVITDKFPNFYYNFKKIKNVDFNQYLRKKEKLRIL